MKPAKPRRSRKQKISQYGTPVTAQLINLNDVKEEEIVQSPPDNQIQTQIESLNAQLAEHSEALLALKDVPGMLKMLSSAMGTMEQSEDDFYDDDYNGISDEQNDMLNKFMESGDQNQTTAISAGKQEEPDSEMLDILNVSQPCNEYGESLREDVATSFTRMLTNRPTKEKMDHWKDEFKPPENCKYLGIPRVNPEIWQQLQSRPRNNDLNMQQQASLISQASVAVSQIADKIFVASKYMPKELGKEVLRLCMEAGSILGLASQEMSIKRKTEIKPYLNKDFASICASKNPTTEWLFGDNVLEQLKASKSSASVMKPAFGSPFPQPARRFHPYGSRPNLNFKRPFIHGKGGQYSNPLQLLQRYQNRPQFQPRNTSMLPNRPRFPFQGHQARRQN